MEHYNLLNLQVGLLEYLLFFELVYILDLQSISVEDLFVRIAQVLARGACIDRKCVFRVV